MMKKYYIFFAILFVALSMLFIFSLYKISVSAIFSSILSSMVISAIITFLVYVIGVIITLTCQKFK